MKHLVFGLFLFFSGCTLHSAAHDLVLWPRDDGRELALRIKFGHPQEWESPDFHRLYHLDAYAPGHAGGISWLKDLTPDDGDLVTKRDPAWPDVKGTWVITGSYDNGFWVELPDKTYFNTVTQELPSGTHGAHYLKYAKALLAIGSPSQDYQRVIGYRLELVPMVDPFTLKIGDKLPVKALYDGKPMVGVGLEIGDGKTKMKEEDIPRYKTNAEGIAELPITHGGFEAIAVDYKTPSRTPDAAPEDNYSSSLTFVLP